MLRSDHQQACTEFARQAKNLVGWVTVAYDSLNVTPRLTVALYPMAQVRDCVPIPWFDDMQYREAGSQTLSDTDRPRQGDTGELRVGNRANNRKESCDFIPGSNRQHGNRA